MWIPALAKEKLGKEKESNIGCWKFCATIQQWRSSAYLSPVVVAEPQSPPRESATVFSLEDNSECHVNSRAKEPYSDSKDSSLNLT